MPSAPGAVETWMPIVLLAEELDGQRQVKRLAVQWHRRSLERVGGDGRKTKRQH